ncbi:MAG: hypothetical protein QM504_11945 [Pseudomonadota bacterium]
MKYLIRAFLFLASFCADAEGYCDEAAEYFKYNYDVSRISDTKIYVVKKIDTDSKLVFTIGENFNGLRDNNGKIQYQLISTKENSIKIRYTYVFDTRSYGNSVEECSGVIVIK